MAVEVAGTCFHCSPAIFTRSPSLSTKTVTHAILSLIHNPFTNSYDRAITTIHYTPFLVNALLHHSLQKQIVSVGRRRQSSSCATFDGFADSDEENEAEFFKRINNPNPKFKIESQSQRNQDAGTSHSIPPVLDPISINREIPKMNPESWLHSDRFLFQNTNPRSNSFDLRTLKKKKQGKSDETTDSAYSSVKKAFFYTLFIVRELQTHIIQTRQLLISPNKFHIQSTLARVHGDLHASFAWLFHRIFSSTPTLMLHLMLLLANFTVFSIANHHSAAAPLLPPHSLSAQIEQFQSPIKTISAVGGSGNGSVRPPAIAGAGDDDGHSDRSRSSSSLGNDVMISNEVISMAWKRIVEETAEMIRANGRCEALMDSDTLRRFVSPVTVAAEPDDLSAYCATEVMYQVAIAENPDDGLLLANFAQFLFAVHRDHDRAEEYFKRAVRAEPVEAETLCRYANFLWVARKDLEAAEETFLKAISADPVNSYYSANYAHFLWTTGAEDTCYPLDDCDA